MSFRILIYLAMLEFFFKSCKILSDFLFAGLSEKFVNSEVHQEVQRILRTEPFRKLLKTCTNNLCKIIFIRPQKF